MKVERVVSEAWYGNQGWIKALSPLSKLYQRSAEKRKRISIENRRSPFVVPVVVVGNITVGGTGKTPLVIFLANQLKTKGVRVGVVSRGYGGKPPSYPYLVKPGDSAENCGEEPLMIAEATGVPVAIDPDRCSAVDMLLNQEGVSMILVDDGLQHYALPRDYEIAVVDAARGLGNGLLLPAGPLREPIERLKEVNFVVANGDPQQLDANISVDANYGLRPTGWINIQTGTRVPLDFLPVGEFDAVAGIGNPSRFFDTLRSLDLNFREHIFPDHHHYSIKDFQFLASIETSLVCMTMKDALKCRGFAGPNFWALDVDLEFETNFYGQNGGQALVDAILALRPSS